MCKSKERAEEKECNGQMHGAIGLRRNDGRWTWNRTSKISFVWSVVRHCICSLRPLQRNTSTSTSSHHTWTSYYLSQCSHRKKYLLCIVEKRYKLRAFCDWRNLADLGHVRHSRTLEKYSPIEWIFPTPFDDRQPQRVNMWRETNITWSIDKESIRFGGNGIFSINSGKSCFSWENMSTFQQIDLNRTLSLKSHSWLYRTEQWKTPLIKILNACRFCEKKSLSNCSYRVLAFVWYRISEELACFGDCEVHLSAKRSAQRKYISDSRRSYEMQAYIKWCIKSMPGKNTNHQHAIDHQRWKTLSKVRSMCLPYGSLNPLDNTTNKNVTLVEVDSIGATSVCGILLQRSWRRCEQRAERV